MNSKPAASATATPPGFCPEGGVAETLRLVLSIFKLRIGFAIMLCALAGAATVSAPALDVWRLSLLALAVLVSSASAGALNQYVERDLDARMARTCERPFATGRFLARWYWPCAILAVMGLSVGMAAASTNVIAAGYVLLGAITYGIVYTAFLKRRTSINIVVGGLAGSFAVLAGAAATGPVVAPAPWLLAAVLFLWTPPHFWSLALAHREQYAAAGVPMLPVVMGARGSARIILAHTVVLVALSLVPAWFGMGAVYLLGAAVGGARFLGTSVRLVRRPTRTAALTNFHASLLQLALLLGAAILDAALGHPGTMG